jgi:carbon storage regulator
MLVVSRKPGQQIVVPQYGLTVTVVAVQGNTVRLGISAPAEIAIHREEVWRRIRQLTDSPSVLVREFFLSDDGIDS